MTLGMIKNVAITYNNHTIVAILYHKSNYILKIADIMGFKYTNTY